MKYSKIYLLNRKEMIDIIRNSSSIKDVLIKLKLSDRGSNRKTFFKYVELNNLSEELIALRNRAESIRNTKLSYSRKKLEDKDVFKENSSYDRGHLKNRIIKDNLIPYKCQKCSNSGLWEGETLVLQLEHINGVPNDNRLENLCFLCPNCHSQTHTYTGRKLRKKLNKEEKIILKENNLEIEKLNFLNKLEEYSKGIDFNKRGWVSSLAKKYNISHTHIRRLLKKFKPELYNNSL